MAQITVLEATRRVASILAPLTREQKLRILNFARDSVNDEPIEASEAIVENAAAGDEDSVGSTTRARRERAAAAAAPN